MRGSLAVLVTLLPENIDTGKSEMTPAQIEQRAVDSSQPWVRHHVEQYLRSDGAEVDHPMASNLILLYTKGRKSGQLRRVPVIHLPDGEDLIIVASKGGAPQHPSWFLNLRHNSQVWVRKKSEVFEATAQILVGEEHDRMWSRITRWAPGFQQYQDKTTRRIPLVRLRRA